MISEVALEEQQYKSRKILSMHPKKFALWLFIVSVTMTFASLTSAYLVRRTEGDWLNFELPGLFLTTSLIIVASSVTLHVAYLGIKKDDFVRLKIWILITTVLGIAFLAGQLISWNQLVDNNVFFVGNPAGSFVYVLSGLHGAHVISGVIFLIVVATKAFRMKIHSKNMLSMNMLVTYWHFLGGLWLYLYLFLFLNR